jgi:AcrR family transcriptional regulator
MPSTINSTHLLPESDMKETPRKRGPRPKGESEQMRLRILDCAEKLFADHGFDGTSIRDIAGLAKVQLTLVGYHFGSKESLFDHVLARRSSVLHDERMKALEEARSRHANDPIPPRELIENYVSSFLARATRDDPGWCNYSTLVANIANSSRWASLVSKHYDPTARAYLVELERSCPEMNKEELHRGFFFMIAIMVAVCSRPGRIERLSNDVFESTDVSAISQSISYFVEGGFRALAGPDSSKLKV